MSAHVDVHPLMVHVYTLKARRFQATSGEALLQFFSRYVALWVWLTAYSLCVSVHEYLCAS